MNRCFFLIVFLNVLFFATIPAKAELLLEKNGSPSSCPVPPPGPSNDDPCDAISLTAGASCTFSTYNNSDASDSGIASPGCASYSTTGGDVWFSVVIPASGGVVIDSNTGDITDGGMAAYSGNNCNSLTLIECDDDDSANGLMPSLTISGQTPGSTIWIRFWEYGGDVSGTFDICVKELPPPPVNDDCANAISLTVNSDFNCGTVTSGTVESATASADANGCSGTSDDDVWYSFVATSTSHRVSLDNVAGSATDMYHSIYEGTCGSLTELSCNDGNTTDITGLTIGNTYYVRVYTYTSTSGQNTTFDICVGTPPPPPVNDDCVNAINLTVNPDHNCGTTTAGTITGATASVDANACGGTANDDVWYSFVATNVSHTIDLLNVAGSTTDLYHSVYEGVCGALSSISCSDADDSYVTGLTPGQTYYVRIYTNGSTTFQTSAFDVCIGTPPPPPANDDCANAIPINVNNNSNCAQTTAGTIAEATPSGLSNPCTGTANDDVWFTFVATSPYHHIELLNVAGSTTDLVHALYEGACASLNLVYCSDSDISATNGLTVGNTYYIRVFSSTSTLPQTTTFDICVNIPPNPPVNDECDGAIALTVNSDLNCGSVTSGTVEYALASSETNPCGGTADDDVWFSFVATNYEHQIDILNAAGSTTDMYHAVYEGVCGSLINLSCSDADQSTVSDLTIGNTYYVRVYTYTSTTGQNSTFDVCIGTPPPPNDLPCDAISLLVEPICNYHTYYTSFATDSGEPDPGCANYSGGDVWFTVVVPPSGNLTVNTSDIDFTDSGMAIYSGSDCNNLTLIECDDDDSPNGNMSMISLAGQTPGDQLWIRVWEYGNNESGNFEICVSNPDAYIAGCNGTFTDSGGAGGNYSTNEDYVVTYCPDMAGYRIEMDFTSFDVEDTYDYVEVYDGNSTSAPLVATFDNGYPLNGIIMATTSNSSGCLTFVFHSDGSGTNAGWEADISCMPPCQDILIDLISTSPAVTMESGWAYIDLCQGGVVDFSAQGDYPTNNTYYNQSDGTSSFTWSFGDGQTSDGQNVSHTYPNGGGYDVNLTIEDVNGCTNLDNLNVRVRISPDPDFTGTLAAPNPVCETEPVTLTGVATQPITEVATGGSVAGTTFLPDGSGVTYSSGLFFDIFNPGQTVTAVSDIVDICGLMEHSYMGDLSMELECPNGQTMTVFNQGGSGTIIGEPVATGLTVDDNTSDLTPGIGYNYCWSPTSTNGYIDDAANWTNVSPYTDPIGNVSTNDPINQVNSGTYQAEGSWANLIGCPLNGTWTIHVTDHLSADNGYIFEWGINFDPSLYPALWSFTPTIVSESWSGPDITSTSNPGLANPATAGTADYVYSVTDDMGCIYDTTITVTVNPGVIPTFNAVGPYCEGDAIPALPTTSTNGITGSWSPAIDNVNTTTYTFTPDAGQCATTTTLDITINVCCPTVTCPPDINLTNCNDPLPAGATTLAEFTALGGTYTNATSVSYSDVTVNGCSTVTTRTYSISNATCTVTCDQIITRVVDAQNPTASNPAPITVQCSGDVPAADITVVTDEADNCTAAPVVAFVNDVSDGNSCPEVITRTYSVTDDCGNSINVTQTITIDDTQNPTASNPAPIVVQCSGDIPATDITVVTDEADNCTAAPVVAFVNDVSDGNTCPEVITRTYSVTDDCGNSINVTQTITIDDTQNPTASNPAPIVVQCSGDIPATDITVVTDEADNCTAAPVVAFVSEVSDGNSCPEVITRTYSVTDDCGNSINVTQTITVDDTQNPTASNPTPITVQCSGDVPAADITVVTDEADNCTAAPVVAFVNDVSDGNSCPEVITRTYSVTDDCGNSINVTQTITIDDTQNPTASNPAPIIVQCSGDVPAADITVVTDEADNCTAAPVVAFVNDVSDGNSCPEVITRTYSVTDDCGNSINVTQTITVDDTQNPTASNPAPITVQCSGDVPAADITVVTDEADNCTAAPVVAFVSEVSDGNSCPEVITRTYSVTDDCGNSINVTQTITIDDTQNPTASNPAPIIVQCSGDVPAADITVVTDEADNCTAAPVVAFVNDVSDGNSCPEVITRTYSVTDDCGNSINVTQTITVDDTQNPTASNPAPITVQCSGDVPAADITVVTDEADNCTAAPVVAFVNDVSDGNSCPEVITRTYSVTDDCGNSINVTQTITVDDTQAPVLTGSPDVTAVEGCDETSLTAPPAETTVAGLESLSGITSIDDLCTIDANLMVTSVDNVVGSCPVVLTRTYTVTDDCGNVLTFDHVINIGDSQAPVLSGTPDAITVEGCDVGAATIPAAESTVAGLEALVGITSIDDNCTVDASLTVTSVDATAGTCPLTITRTYTVSDACGNVLTFDHVISVDDTQAPVLTGTPDATAVEGCDAGAATVPVAETTVAGLESLAGITSIDDLCTIDANLTVSSVDATAGTCPLTITRTYTVTDECGNVLTFDHIITVDDTQAPVLAGAPDATAVEGCDAGAATVPVAATTIAGLESLAGITSIDDLCTIDANLTVSSVDATAGTCPLTITRTYTVTDECGNVLTFDHVITVDDTQAPVLTGSPDVTAVEGCDETSLTAPPAETTVAGLESLSGITSIDDLCTIDANLMVTSVDNVVGSCPVVLTRTYTVTDDCGNVLTFDHVINIGDSQAPVLSGTPDAITVEGCDAGAATIPAAETTVAGLETLAGITSIDDNCTADASLTVTSVDATAGTCPLTITRTYTVIDACGNVLTFDHVISVDDTQAPVLTGTPDATAVEGCDAGAATVPVAETTVAGLESLAGITSIDDLCTIDANLTVSSVDATAGTCPLTITRTYTVTDECGNVLTFDHIITVDDTQAPVLAGAPDATAVEGCDAGAATVPVAATTIAGLESLSGITSIDDLCTIDANLTVSSVDATAGTCPLTITRTYTITDECGNVLTFDHVITVDDTQAPVLTGSPDITSVEGCDETSLTAPPAETTVAGLESLSGITSIDDLCTIDANLTVSSVDNVVGTCPVVLTRTYTVTDECGNVLSFDHVINIGDSQAPVLSGTPDAITVEGCDAGAATIPAAETTVAGLETLSGITSIDDNCTADASLTVSSVDATAGTCPLVITRTYTVSDACGNVLTFDHVISVDDTQAPVLTGAPDATAVEGCDAGAATVPVAETTVAGLESLAGITSIDDLCTIDANLTVSSVDATAGTCPLTITRTYTVTDECGNVLTFDHIITVDDTQAPVLAGAPDATVVEGCDAGAATVPVAATTIAGLESLSGITSIDDLCTIDANLTVSSVDATAGTCPLTITRTYTVTDECGNVLTFDHVITVDDTQAPVLTGSPDITSVEGCDETSLTAPPAETTVAGLESLSGITSIDDLCTIDANLTVSSVDNVVGTCPVVLTRTYTVTDECGNVLSFDHVINIGDSQAPVLSGTPDAITVEGCDAGAATIPAAETTVAGLETLAGITSIDDNCTADASLTVSSVDATAGTCPLTITRTYTVIDACGNVLTFDHVISVDDTQAPVLTGTPDATAVEGCDAGAATVPVAETTVAGLESLAGITSIDDLCTIDANLTVSSVDATAGTCPLTITRTYTVTDECGNVLTFDHVITVDDTQAPVLAGAPDATAVEGCDAGAATVPAAETTVAGLEALAGITSIDDLCTIDANLTVASVDATAGTCPLTITRTYTITDECGNVLTFDHVITVDDTQAPVLTGSPDITSVEGCDETSLTAPPAETTVAGLESLSGITSIDDLCTIDANLMVSSVDNVVGTCPVVLTRTYTVTDECGNVLTFDHVINIGDSQAPVLTGTPDALSVEGCDAGAATIPAAESTVAGLEALVGITSIDDNCTVDASLTVTSVDATAGTCPLTITRTYTVIDACGNVLTFDHVISVDDTQAPVLTGAPDATAVEGCDAGAATVPVAETTVAGLESLAGITSIDDLCTIDANLTVSSVDATAGTCPLTITRTYTVTDECGNVLTFDHVITVDDTQAPVLAGAPDATAVEGCDAGAATVPAAETTVAGLEALAGITSIDDLCTIDANLTVSSVDATAGTCPLTITRTYTITDECGNVLTFDHVITVDDTQAPVLTGSPDVTAVEGCDETSLSAPVAETTVAGLESLSGITSIDDLCTIDANLMVSSVDNVVGTCPVVLTRTYTVTDECGNVLSFDHVINIGDSQAPVLSGTPDAITVEGCDAGAATIPAAETTVAGLETLAGITSIDDNCTADASLTVTSVDATAGTCPLTITRTYTVSDACGNVLTFDHVISVDDTQAPVLTGAPDATAVEGCDAGAATVPVAETTVAGLESLAGITSIDDLCTIDANLTVSSVDATAGTCPLTITRTYTVTDECGNVLTFDHIITVDDTQAPVLAGAPDATAVEGCDAGAAAVPVAATTIAGLESLSGITSIDDLCTIDANLTVSSVDATAGTCPMTITRTYTVTDECGNVLTFDHVITVDDTQAPVLTGSPDITSVEGCDETSLTAPPAETTVAGLESLSGITSIDDLCTIDANLTVSSVDNVVGTCPVVLTRTYTVTDECDNVLTFDHVINIGDSQAPVLTGTPDALSVEGCDAGAATIPAAESTVAGLEALVGITSIDDNCTVDASLTVTSVDATAGTCPLTITRTYTVIDACGNVLTFDHVISVDDTQAPVLTGTPDATAVEGCDAGAATVPVAETTVAGLESLAGITSIDDLCTIDANLTVSSVDATAGTCPLTITRTYTVTDECGNVLTFDHIITVDDTQAPVLAGAPDATAVEGCDAGAATVPVAATTIAGLESLLGITSIDDLCTIDANLTVSSVDATAGTCPLTITRTYTITDECGNVLTFDHIITVDDTQAPVLTGSPDITSVEGCDETSLTAPPAETTVAGLESLSGITSIDDLCTIDANLMVTSVDNVVGTCPVVLTRTYTVTDECGNVLTFDHVINIGDSQAPTASSPAPITVDCITDIPVADINEIIDEADNCTVVPVVTYIGDVSDGGTCPEIITRTYRIIDDCGNFTDVDQIITIIPVISPVVPADGSASVTCPVDAVAPATPIVVDVCGNNIVPTLVGTVQTPDPVTCSGTITYTYEYMDCAGNATNWNFVYTVSNSFAPVVPADEASTVECLADAIAPTTPVVVDACGNNIVAVFESMVDTPDPMICEGSRIYTYSYTDCAGNISYWTYTYAIDMTIPPVVPADGLSTVECLADAVAPTTPVVLDNCGNNIVPSLVSTVDTPDPLTCEGTRTYTYEYMDCAGNATNWSYVYTIDMTIAPVVPADGSASVECLVDAVAPVTPVVVDNCGHNIVPALVSTVDTPDPMTCEGTRTYTYEYLDCAGNATNWNFVYTIDMITAPVVPADGASTVECLVDAVAPTTPVVVDVCGNNVVPTLVSTVDAPDPMTCEGARTYTYEYLDCSGNATNWNYVYTIDMTVAPVVPADGSASVTCPVDAVAPATPVVVDVCGNNIVPTLVGTVQTPDPVTCSGTITYTYEYMDCAGNATNWNFVYTVSNSFAPVVPADEASTVECLADAIAPTTPVVVDACGNNIVAVFESMVDTPDPMICEGSRIYTYSYTDCAGNISYWTYTYAIDMTIPPVVPADGLSTVECLADAVAPTTPVVLDNCGNNIVPSLVSTVDTPDPLTCEGTRTYTYEYMDCAGNATNWSYVYTIDMTIAPVVPADGSASVECLVDAVAPVTPVVVDNCGHNIVPALVSTVDTPDPMTCEGTRTYTYEYLDCAGNATLWNYVYTIDMITAPVVSADGNSTVDCVADAVAPTTPIVVDNCGNSVSAVLESIVNSPDPLVCAGTRTYNYSYTDCAGNVSTWSYVYTISDPVISVTCPSDLSFDAIPGDNYTIPELIAMDNCSGGFTVNWTITGATNRTGSGTDASGYFALGVSVIEWEVTDQCGNVHNCTTTVEVLMPVVLCPDPIAVCVDAGMQLLSGTGEDPVGGEFSGNGVVENAGQYYFNPAHPLAGEGTHTLIYSWANSGGYTGTCTFEVTVFGLPEFTSSITQQPLCYNSSDGIVALSFSGGFPQYDISWDTQSITSTTNNAVITGLNYGNTLISVTDANGCAYQSSVNLINPPVLTATATAVDVTCNGYSDGEATAFGNGGTGDYTYMWSYGSQSTQTAVGLPADQYTVTVYDENLCEATAVVNVTENPAVTATITNSSDVLCSGDCNGTATVNPQGGDSDFTIGWGVSPVQTGLTAEDLCQGTYYVTVTDGNGCEASTSAVINSPTPLSISVLAVQPVTCAGYSDGSITVVANGGTGSPGYSWSGSSSLLPHLTGATGDTYVVTAVDENGCEASESITVNEPDALEISETVTHVQCGMTPGACSVNVTGGTGAMEYDWVDYSMVSGPSLTGLGEGEYTVNVTDGNGCSSQKTMMVSTMGSLFVSITEDIPINCFGESGAQLSATCSNGFGAVDFIWLPNSENSVMISNLASGIYSVRATDEWGCTGDDSYQVVDPDPLFVTFDVDNVACLNGADGSVVANAVGGSEPYYYNWTQFGFTQSLSDLSSGWYHIVVIDDHACEKVDSVFVGQPENPLGFMLNKENITCFGDNDGSLSALAYGGSAPYSYQWTLDEETSNDTAIYNLSEGFYSLIITDDNGCVSDTVVVIQEPAPLVVDYSSINPSCIGNSDGSIEIEAMGGTEPYTYVWDLATANMPYFEGLYEGSYQISVRDANGCEHDLNTITLVDVPEECLRVPDAFTPNDDDNNDTWIIENIELFNNYHIEVYNRWGQVLYIGDPGSEPWDGTTTEGNPVPTGSYIYVINLHNGSKPKSGIVTVIY